MKRVMAITDHGKDYGQGRYAIEATDLKRICTDNYNEVSLIAMRFDEPCDGCKASPEDCPGILDCKVSYGR